MQSPACGLEKNRALSGFQNEALYGRAVQSPVGAAKADTGGRRTRRIHQYESGFKIPAVQPVPLRSGSARRSEIHVEGGREKIGARDGARIACGVPAIRDQEVAREAEFDRGRIAACASDAAENHAFAAP